MRGLGLIVIMVLAANAAEERAIYFADAAKPGQHCQSVNSRYTSEPVLDIHVALEIGGDPERLEHESVQIYQEIGARTLKSEETIARLETVERKLASNRPGTYRVRAVYRPNIAGKWKGELATEPVTIVITDAK